MTSSLSTTSLKSAGTVFNLSTSKSSIFDFKLFKLVGTSTSLLMSKISTLAFKATKSFLAAKSDVSIPLVCSNSNLCFNTTLTFSLTWLSGSGY